MYLYILFNCIAESILFLKIKKKITGIKQTFSQLVDMNIIYVFEATLKWTIMVAHVLFTV